MAKLSESGYRFPEQASGIQVNFCKNIRCPAFGVPETQHRVRRSKASAPAPGDYSRNLMSTGNKLTMECGVCGVRLPVRSNRAIAEELARLTAHIRAAPAPSCPDEGCDNFGTPVTEQGRYARFGKTRFGTPRWRCNSCKKTFSESGAPLLRQRKAHKNRDVFMLLVNKSPIRRIAEVTGLDPKTVYGKIDFISRQCAAFVGERERKLFEGFPIRRAHVAVDRQVHNVNWSNRKDRRNVSLTAIGSADLKTGYVFGFHLNFDPTLAPAQVERDAALLGDPARDEAFREYARVWLSSEHESSTAGASTASARKRKGARPGQVVEAADILDAEISSAYEVAGARKDIEAAEPSSGLTTLPELGMLIKEQYTMHGHFQMLAKMLSGAEKVRVYLDQDSGIRAAFFGAFIDRIKDRTADGWYVAVMKEATITQKEKAVQQARARLKDAADRYPGLSTDALLVALMKEEMGQGRTLGQFDDRWLAHPYPSMAEPAKKMCWLTDMGDYNEDHAAVLYLKASLHAVDRFFMQTRRLLSLAERSLRSASADRRVWHGYSAYRPENLAKVLEVFRVYYNYCKVGDDKKTPAMRLGLARAPIAVEDVLYYTQ